MNSPRTSDTGPADRRSEPRSAVLGEMIGWDRPHHGEARMPGWLRDVSPSGAGFLVPVDAAIARGDFIHLHRAQNGAGGLYRVLRSGAVSGQTMAIACRRVDTDPFRGLKTRIAA
ncbi:MAG: hypothetical protein CMJ18_15670 [Phycisphaeraceae bacterium]|nr:hypothetical protein [Phycisphaeraceae bacterium]